MQVVQSCANLVMVVTFIRTRGHVHHVERRALALATTNSC